MRRKNFEEQYKITIARPKVYNHVRFTRVLFRVVITYHIAGESYPIARARNPSQMNNAIASSVKSATDLGELAASVGLAYNLAVLQMLVTDGILSV